MSDDPAAETDAPAELGDEADEPTEVAADATAELGDAPADAADDGSGGPRFRRVLNYGLLAGMLLLALVAAVGFYTAVSSAITTWVADEWRPVFRAAFNLAVLLVAGAGIAWQTRRIA